jgi:hypothetical protein
VRRLWRASNARFCDTGEGVLDPSEALAAQQSTLDRSLRWSSKRAVATYASPCSAGLQVVNLHTGHAAVLGAQQWWHSPSLSRTGALAVVAQTTGTPSHFSIELVRPITSTVVAILGAGETPSWSSDDTSIYYQQRAAQSTLVIGSGAATITSTVYLTSIYRAKSGAGSPRVLARLHDFYLAGLSPVPGGDGVVFGAVGNDGARTKPLSAGESLDVASRKPGQPRVDVEELDGSGRITVVVPNAGLPAIQPVLAS